jgi:hypothetical protein
MVDKIFEEDEMTLSEVKPEWQPEILLSQKSIFYLKDILDILYLDPVKVKRKANEIKRKGESPWESMGVRKMWTHWIVRMSVFAPYYKKHLKSKVKPINPDWDGNTLLKQKGLFLLTSVCKLIPFSAHQLRYRAKTNPNASKEYGIWKEDDLNAFVVDMEIFSRWVKGLWNGEFS